MNSELLRTDSRSEGLMHKRVMMGNNGWMRKDTIHWTWAVSLSLGRFPESGPISWAWADSLGLGRFPELLIRVMVLLLRTKTELISATASNEESICVHITSNRHFIVGRPLDSMC